MKALIVGLCVGLVCLGSPVDAAAGGGAPTIKLLEAGSGPKQELRFATKKGARLKVVMTMDMGLGMGVAGTKPTVQMAPTMRMAMDMKVTDVAKNGDIRYEFKMRNPEVLPAKGTPREMVVAMKASLAGIAGTTGYAVVSNRGFTKEGAIQVPPNASAQLKQMMSSVEQSLSQLSAPLPEEAVGVGARWETTTHVVSNGMSLDQLTTTELLSAKGKRVQLRVALVQKGARQTFKANGVDVELHDFQGGGSGTMDLDLTKLVPTTSSLTMQSELEMTTMGQRFAMAVKMLLGVKAR